MSASAEPFTRASLLIGPVIEEFGFHLVSREYAEGVEASAFAEYARGPVRLRLVWEGTERLLWIESARASGGSMISRWQDVEWIVAGKPLPPDPALDDERLDRLGEAVVSYLRMISAVASGESHAAN